MQNFSFGHVTSLAPTPHEVPQDFLGHLMSLMPVSASHDADGIINETIAFPRSKELK